MGKVKLHTASVSYQRHLIHNRQILKQVRWIPPNEYWIGINVDGVVNKNKRAGYGGLL